jgi:hypothetical protein
MDIMMATDVVIVLLMLLLLHLECRVVNPQLAAFIS